MSSVCNDPRLQHHADHQVVQRPQQVGTGRQPVAQRRAVQEQTLPLVDAFQAMQRQVIDVLADDQVGQQARPRQSLGNRHRRLGRGDHHLAGVQAAGAGAAPAAVGRVSGLLAGGCRLGRRRWPGVGAGSAAAWLGFWFRDGMGSDSWPGGRCCSGACAGRLLQHGQTYLWTKCSITNNDAGR